MLGRQVLSYYLNLFEEDAIDLAHFQSSNRVNKIVRLKERARKANGGLILQSAKYHHAIKITATGGKDVLGSQCDG